VATVRTTQDNVLCYPHHNHSPAVTTLRRMVRTSLPRALQLPMAITETEVSYLPQELYRHREAILTQTAPQDPAHHKTRSPPRFAHWTNLHASQWTSKYGAIPALVWDRFPPNNFKYFLTLFSKFFSSFPHGTCSLSVSR